MNFLKQEKKLNNFFFDFWFSIKNKFCLVHSKQTEETRKKQNYEFSETIKKIFSNFQKKIFFWNSGDDEICGIWLLNYWENKLRRRNNKEFETDYLFFMKSNNQWKKLGLDFEFFFWEKNFFSTSGCKNIKK